MKNILRNRIKELRKKKGVTQGELAEKIGVHIQTLSRYERGINEIPADVLIKIFEELQPSSGWLLTGEGEMFIASDIPVPEPPPLTVTDPPYSSMKASAARVAIGSIVVEPDILSSWPSNIFPASSSNITYPFKDDLIRCSRI